MESIKKYRPDLGAGIYFLSGCMAINASQFIGAPLSLINSDWYDAWIAFTKQSFGILTTTMTQFWAPTLVRVSGDSSVRGQLTKTANGDLLCNFPKRTVLIANHQIYTDWLYMWWIGYTAGMHGHFYIILKESLKRIPVIGWGMQFSKFIFLKRNWEQDKANLEAHMQKLNVPDDPMWLLLFPEGTNLARDTRESSAKWAQKNGIRDMKHELLPRSTGLRFVLQQLRTTVKYVYDCTIAYEGVRHGEYAQDIFTLRSMYVDGTPPKSVNMFWRRFPIAKIPLDDPQQFDLWLRARWAEKDRIIDRYLRTGRFPADDGVTVTSQGKTLRGAGYIETEIKASRWYDFLQVFAPIGLFALVLYMFYGALPSNLVDNLNKKGLVDAAQSVPGFRVQGREQQMITNAATKATPKALLRAATTRDPAHLTGTVQKQPFKPMAGQKVILRGAPAQQAHAEVAQKQKQIKVAKQQSFAAPAKPDATSGANAAQKKAPVKPVASVAPKKLMFKDTASMASSSQGSKLSASTTPTQYSKSSVATAPKKSAPTQAVKKPAVPAAKKAGTVATGTSAAIRQAGNPKPTGSTQKTTVKAAAKPATK